MANQRRPIPAKGGEERPCVAADVLAFTAEKGRLKLMLVRRAAPPYEGRWAIPGGSIGIGESAEAAASRAFGERTGIDAIYMEQLYTFSAPRRDPRRRTISVAYLALAPKSRLRAAAQARPETVGLFDVLPGEAGAFLLQPEDGGPGVAPEALAFDHAEIIRTALSRMAGKLEYTDIGFECLEDKGRFTLSELCEVYAAIAGKAYDFPNFRRFIKKRYEETGRIAPTGERLRKRGTPAVLYRWKEDGPWSGD